ncbi:MAG: putative transposase [Halioglobus sp.]|jgi:putative transposase
MTMKKTRKRHSNEEKLKILKEVGMKGVTVTLKKYGIYPATFYNWKTKFEEMGAEGLSHSMTKERLAKIKVLEQEVSLLKQLLADKEIESKLKDELLKKKYPKVRKKYS